MKFFSRLVGRQPESFSVVCQIFIFTVNIGKKEATVDDIGPNLRDGIKLDPDSTLFEMCPTFVILPRKTPYCVV